MPTETFPIRLAYPLSHELIFANLVVDFGDGHEQRINKNLLWGPRADGEGELTSYYGINRFTVSAINLHHVNADITKAANLFWHFYKQQRGSFVPFYFYNPGEDDRPPTLPPLSTGVAEIGRYLVRFEEDRLTRELFAYRLYNMGVSMREVRA